MTKYEKWSDEEKLKYIDSFDPSDDQLKQICNMCEGDGILKGYQRDEQGVMKEAEFSCPPLLSSDGIWSSLRYLLNQFITCDYCRKQKDVKSCEGCMVERDQIADLAWHYSQALINENLKTEQRQG